MSSAITPSLTSGSIPNIESEFSVSLGVVMVAISNATVVILAALMSDRWCRHCKKLYVWPPLHERSLSVPSYPFSRREIRKLVTAAKVLIERKNSSEANSKSAHK